jgi:hypothetical protein
VRVDPSGDRVTARIRLRGAPYDIAAGAGAVWATGRLRRGDDVLYRIDPKASRVAATISLPGRRAGPIAATRRAVWVVVSDQEVRSYSLVRIDPSTNRVVRTARLDAARRRWVTDIAVADHAVWLLALRLGARGEEPGDVLRFEPRSNRLTARIEASALAMGAGPGGVWVSGCTVCRPQRDAYFGQRIDPGTNRPARRRVVVPHAAFGPLSVGRARVWFGGYENAGRTIAFRLDPRTGRIDRFLRLGTFLHSGMALDPRARALWVARAPGRIVRVDLAHR